MNESVADYDLKLKKKLSKICKDLVKSEKTVKTERLELKPLEISPSFELSVTLLHKEEDDIYQEFMAAVQIIGVWAQGRFRNVTDDIPLTPDDYEFHFTGIQSEHPGKPFSGILQIVPGLCRHHQTGHGVADQSQSGAQ